MLADIHLRESGVNLDALGPSGVFVYCCAEHWRAVECCGIKGSQALNTTSAVIPQPLSEDIDLDQVRECAGRNGVHNFWMSSD
ncbi:hypothetical protein MHYP_G00336580 [Metynnis hypsauchen]